MRKKKPPTKREAVKAITTHNMSRFIKSVDRVQAAFRHLDCAMSEAKLYASMIAGDKKGARK